MDWSFLALLAGGLGIWAWRARRDDGERDERGERTGLSPARDLSHLPEGLTGSALWQLCDGGFERRVLRGAMAEVALGGPSDIEVTAFDLETLRERRGEWAYLPVDRPFRIRGVVTVAVCELPGPLPHVLCKRDGRGDDLRPDDWLERETNVAKATRDALGLAHRQEAELPPGLAVSAREVPGVTGWRAYAKDEVLFGALMRGGLAEVLADVELRDLVVELVGHCLIAYPATRDALGAQSFAELCGAAVRAAAAVNKALAPSPG